MSQSQEPFAPPQNPNQQTKSQEPIDPTYNLVTDLVTGANLRKQDNLFQAAFIAVSAIIFALVGSIAAISNSSWNLPWFGGALIGGFIGVVVGLLTSGIGLMIYRAVRHISGKHD